MQNIEDILYISCVYVLIVVYSSRQLHWGPQIPITVAIKPQIYSSFHKFSSKISYLCSCFVFRFLFCLRIYIEFEFIKLTALLFFLFPVTLIVSTPTVNFESQDVFLCALPFTHRSHPKFLET